MVVIDGDLMESGNMLEMKVLTGKSSTNGQLMVIYSWWLMVIWWVLVVALMVIINGAP